MISGGEALLLYGASEYCALDQPLVDEEQKDDLLGRVVCVGQLPTHL